MRVGKFNPELLQRLLAKAKVDDPRVLLGPKIGEDAALIDYGDRVLVAKTDPVTFASHLIGWYVVQVNANDVACTGATPLWFLATLLIPETMAESGAEGIFDQVLEACRSLGVTLVGGHSEVTQGITQPIVVGCMLGEVQKGNVIRTGGAQEGDSIVLTKGIALEGTALLAYEAPEALAKAGITAGKRVTVVRAKELLATAAGVGLEVDEAAIPVMHESREICEALGLDPLGLLASGSLLITTPSTDVPRLLSALEAKDITASEIGRVTGASEGVRLTRAGKQVLLPSFERDELARYLSP